MALYTGTNYHPHDWDEARWETDIDLMKKAGFTTVRLGHLCWDSYEPDEGVYTFEWFDKVMNLFADAGIGVVLDISMRPAPIWVHKLCPGCEIYGKSGNMAANLTRYMEDVDDPAYQHYALRFAKLLVNRYKEHPALFAFGLCNELGAGFMSFSSQARARFINWLRKKYGTIDELNKAWATQRWSRKLLSFDDVVLQENEVTIGPPEAWLDMRRFFSDGIGGFISKLADIVDRDTNGIPHSSNHFGGKENLGFDYHKFSDDFVDYPGVGFYPGFELGRTFQYLKMANHERLAETGKPMWFLEFQTGRDGVFAAPEGYIRMHAMMCLINRGQMILGWTWRSMLGGKEQYHHGILGHDGRITPNYEAFTQVASYMKKLEEYGFPYLPDPEIAVAYSRESDWMTQYFSGQFRQNYIDAMIEVQKIFYYRNQDYNMVDLRNLKNNYKLIIIPNHIIIEPAAALTIRRFVEQGGTVIMTGYCGTVDETGKAYSTPKPGLLEDVFGICVAGFYPTDIEGFHSPNAQLVNTKGVSHELLRVEKSGKSFMIDVGYYEDVELNTAQAFASFPDKNMCAVSKNSFGRGTAYYAAAESNQELLGWLVDLLADELNISKGLDVPSGVQARKVADNQFFYVNTTREDITVPISETGKGVLSGGAYDKEFLLKAYDAELIIKSQ